MFPPQCTFCDKLEVKVSGKTVRCSRFPVYKNIGGSFKEPTLKQIEPRALELELYRLHRKVHGEDLFAKEANLHPSCRNSFSLQYINHVQKQQHVGTDATQDDKTAAHQSAFSAVLEFVWERVIGHHGIVQLPLLQELYVKELHGLKFPNPDYRNAKLKSKLQKHEIHDHIAFAVILEERGCIAHAIVYSTNISVAGAVVCAYKLETKNKLETYALSFRNNIKEQFNNSNPLPWPPTPDDIEMSNLLNFLPSTLVPFFNLLIEVKLKKTTEKIHNVLFFP